MPIKSKIRTIKDYPKKGIMFRDITTLIKDPVGFRLVIDSLTQRYITGGVAFDVIVGIESRGFILGGALAYTLGRGFVPIRKKGKLPWPAAGKILQRFGIQRHPQFNTLTLNNGIEIAPPKDDLIVRAVHTGKVVFADYFQGYGNLIIIDHALTYYSLYGHCAKFLVQKGDIVQTDQPIPEAGDTGSMFDVESLYFEIRYLTKPLDPLQWLRRR